jgi:Flp pilus assembly pilin Flp
MSTFLRDQRGATAIEYALISAMISIALIATMQVIGQKVTAMLAAIVF